jgi:hypothetical protein
VQRVGQAEGQPGRRQRGHGYRPPVTSVARRKPWTASQPTSAPAAKPIAISCTKRRARSPGRSRALDPLDEAQDEQHGDRVVEARLGLERAGQAAAQRRPAQQREDRRAVGRAEDRADEQPLEQRQVEEHHRASAVIAAVSMVPKSARLIAGRRTGRISMKPAVRPPSNRISASATMPIVCAIS